MTRRIRTLLLDDEPLARQRLREMLREHPDIEVVAECEDAPSALESARLHRPDLLLLDIEVPGRDGLALLEALQQRPAPIVVFVTAYAQHAARAFEVEATDYLLKPYDEIRLARSLERVRTALQRATEGKPAGTRYPARLTVTSGRRTLFVPVREIDWISAEGNYTQLHVSGRSHLLRTSLTALEAQLDPAFFARVHRSSIVALDRVREVRRDGDREHVAVLSTGGEVPISERYLEALLAHAPNIHPS